MLQYATYYTLICGLSQYDLRPFIKKYNKICCLITSKQLYP